MSRRSIRSSAGATLLVLLATGTGAGPAAAQAQDSARVDPKTPAGTEYAIPLEQARREGGGGGKAPIGGGHASRSSDEPALFGAGITKKGRGHPTRGTAPLPTAPRGRDGRAPKIPGGKTSLAAAGGSSGSLQTIAIILGVLLGGAGIGLGLRRALRDS